MTGHQHGHQHDVEAEQRQFDDLLDLDGVVLRGYWDAALDVVRTAAGRPGPRRILDLGAGSGTGALGLAARFPDAEVLAVDMTAGSLARLADHAAAAGVGERVRTVCADLDAGWPELGHLDLTWASMSLHHLADPSAALRTLLGITGAGGVLAVAELAEPLRFLPADSPAAAAEEQLVAVSTAAHIEIMPTLGSSWAPRIAEAGWTLVDEHVLATIPSESSTPEAYRYAHSWLSRQLERLADRLAPADRDALQNLLTDGPQGLRSRTPLDIRGSRTVTIARR